LLPYFGVLVQIAHLLRELISLFERPRTRLVWKIGSQNQSIGTLLALSVLPALSSISFPIPSAPLAGGSPVSIFLKTSIKTSINSWPCHVLKVWPCHVLKVVSKSFNQPEIWEKSWLFPSGLQSFRNLIGWERHTSGGFPLLNHSVPRPRKISGTEKFRRTKPTFRSYWRAFGSWNIPNRDGLQGNPSHISFRSNVLTVGRIYTSEDFHFHSGLTFSIMISTCVSETQNCVRSVWDWFGSARRQKEGCRSESAPRDKRNILVVRSCGRYLRAYYAQICLRMSRESWPWLAGKCPISPRPSGEHWPARAHG